eukprot:5707684-Amphidinium_carterae.1
MEVFWEHYDWLRRLPAAAKQLVEAVAGKYSKVAESSDETPQWELRKKDLVVTKRLILDPHPPKMPFWWVKRRTPRVLVLVGICSAHSRRIVGVQVLLPTWSLG